ncbi:Lon protease proteolytic domain protein, partial [Cooperia oncophora]
LSKLIQCWFKYRARNRARNASFITLTATWNLGTSKSHATALRCSSLKTYPFRLLEHKFIFSALRNYPSWDFQKERFTAVDLVEQMGKFRLGTCFGLAWTPFGGELMVIEANRCSGKGKTVMTGKLGDVLRESVDVARTWIRANATRLHADNLDGADLHVHLPSGAVGKDGPSAGCALVAALFSLASNRLVRADTAVTGEISLTGHILPVGGIKEKVLGAHRAGIRRVILPLANRSDAEHIDKSIKDEMDIKFTSDIDDLLEKIMEKDGVSNVLSKL